MTYDSQHVAMLAPGTILHHYRIGSTIGEGAMGVVYEGLDTRLQRPVAVKVLPLDNVADPARKDRFAQEAQAASALNHPNIVTIHDVGSDPLGDGDREMARAGEDGEAPIVEVRGPSGTAWQSVAAAAISSGTRVRSAPRHLPVVCRPFLA